MSLVPRNGTAAQWTTANPVLRQGELGVETDTGDLKVGDGVTAWSSLSYLGGGGGGPFAPLVHAHAGTDITTGTVAAARLPTLSGLLAPTGSVDFNDQQALDFRVENRISDPASPTVGQIWLRTDL